MSDLALLELLRNQQQQILDQRKLFVTLTSKLEKLCDDKAKIPVESRLKESVCASIQEFQYDPETGVIFSNWYKQHEEFFLVEAAALDDATKVRILMQKMGTTEHTKYCNYILPKNPWDYSLAESVKILSDIFGEHHSLFNIRYNCLKLVHNCDEDIVTYVGRVNNECERFKLDKLTADQFKALVFVTGLSLPEKSDIRTRLLSKLDSASELTIQQLSDEYVRLRNIKHDTEMIQSGAVPTDVATVDKVPRSQSLTPQFQRPPSACWKCGRFHFVKFFSFRNHLCTTCNRVGHSEERCFRQKQIDRPSWRGQSNLVFTTASPTFRQLGRYITLTVFGCVVTLQVDTASDITIISKDTWRSIGSPKYQTTAKKAKNASGQYMNFFGVSLEKTSNNVKFGDGEEY